MNQTQAVVDSSRQMLVHDLQTATAWRLVLVSAGLALPKPVDGRSLTPFLRGMDITGWPDDVFSQYNGEGISLYSVRAVHSRRYKYVYYPYDQDELYDEEGDPWELNNLAEDPDAAPILTEMRGRLARWMEQVDDVLVDWNVNLTPQRPAL